MITPEAAQAIILKQRESHRRSYQKHKDKVAEYHRQRYKEHHKEGQQKHSLQYYNDHKEERNECMRQYYQEHKEEHAEYMRQYYEEHKEEIGRHNRQWNEEHKEEMAEYMRQYFLNNREKFRNACRKRRALIAGSDGHFTEKEFGLLCEACENKCVYCGLELPLVPDHATPLSRGGSNTIENILPACFSCNSRKRDKTYDEFVEMLDKEVIAS